MKQLLLIAMIHVLIFHQYQKDKKEALAPKKEPSTKISPFHSYQDDRPKGILLFVNDRMRYAAYQHYPYQPGISQDWYTSKEYR